MSNVSVTGSVQAKRQDGKAIKVDGSWYTVYRESYLEDVHVGDTVTFGYVKNNQWLNIKTKVEVLGSKPVSTGTREPSGGGGGNRYKRLGDFPIPSDDGARSITRQNALTNAVNLYGTVHRDPKEKLDLYSSVEEILVIAHRFESYTSGDEDAIQDEAALHMLNNNPLPE